MKILTIVGARPQFIKEAILNKTFKQRGISQVLVNTGQHYDANMSDVFMEELVIPPAHYNLGVGSGSHAFQTATTMMRLEEVIAHERPSCVLIYGDTNATLAGALVASKMKIPVVHVEAGLRQHPKDMPEEINRVVTDRLSALLFCPTIRAVENLKKEGITQGVHFVGDVMYDLFVMMKPHLPIVETLQRYGLKEKAHILATLHRDFNTDDLQRLRSILQGLQRVNQKMQVVLPLHPRTKKAIAIAKYERFLEGFVLMEPLGYPAMMSLLCGAKKVITDSGGLQKEAYFAKVPALVMMPDTSWIELIEAGWNVLVDADAQKIEDAAFHHEPSMSSFSELYGSGDAGEKIVETICTQLF